MTSHFLKSTILAGLLCIAAGMGSASADETYVVLKSAGKPDFPITDAAVQAAGPIEFKLQLDDVDGEIHVVKGARLRDLLAAAGETGMSVVARAKDGYEAEIPSSDITTYDVILAVAVDGKPIPADENGPARIAYPLLDVPALKDNKDVADRSVFLLQALTAK